jgi:cyclopropane-fatty-acyl-phospholipid synthase
MMNLRYLLAFAAARCGFPDSWLRLSIDRTLELRARALVPASATASHFAAWMAGQPEAAAAGTTTMLPAAFYETFLGPQMHLGRGIYGSGRETLMAAEQAALHDACDRAMLANGQEILDLGCGWGAMTLLMAETYPAAHITALAQSRQQYEYVQAQTAARGLQNVTVVLSSIADFEPVLAFDRVVCLDMFSQQTNWRAALTQLRAWMTRGGRMFLQVPTHITTPYCLDAADTLGGAAPGIPGRRIIASQGLIREFGDLFTVAAEQHYSGTHMARTALQWLENFDRNHEKAGKLLRTAYGAQAPAWQRHWRLFFLSMAQMHSHAFGDVWGVGQYVLTPQRNSATVATAAARGEAAFLRHELKSA